MGIAASQFFRTLLSPNPSTDSEQSSYIEMLIEMGLVYTSNLSPILKIDPRRGLQPVFEQ